METSIFCFATDLADEGIEAVLDNVERRGGLGGVTVAAAYHEGRDVFPHNPSARCGSSRAARSSSRPDRRSVRRGCSRP